MTAFKDRHLLNPPRPQHGAAKKAHGLEPLGFFVQRAALELIQRFHRHCDARHRLMVARKGEI